MCTPPLLENEPTSNYSHLTRNEIFPISVSRCRFGGKNMFGGFHVLAGLLIKLRPKKKGTVVWSLVGMFGGSMSSDCFGGFLDQIMTGKNRYSCLAIGCNVWGFHELGLFWRVCCYVFRRVPRSNYKLRPKKKVQLSGHRLEINTESEDNINLQIGMALSIK